MEKKNVKNDIITLNINKKWKFDGIKNQKQKHEILMRHDLKGDMEDLEANVLLR